MFYPSTLAFLIFVGVSICPLTAKADVDLQSLVTRSPFGEAKTGAGGGRGGSLEFRGYYVDNGITYFSIYNPSSKSSVWVAEGEVSTTPFAVSVKNFDPVKNAVTLESNGQSMNLSLHESVIVKMDLPATPGAAPANNNSAAPTTTATAAVGSANAGQAPTTEQVQAFKDSMRQRWQDRQNQNGGNENGKNKGNKAAETTTTTENTNAAKKGQKNKVN